MVIAQPARDHLGEPHQHGLKRGRVRGIDRKSVLVADGFGVVPVANLPVEPSSGVLAARLAGQRQPPFSEAIFEESLVELRQVADLTDPAAVKIAFGYFADSRDLAHVEGSQKPRLASRRNP